MASTSRRISTRVLRRVAAPLLACLTAASLTAAGAQALAAQPSRGSAKPTRAAPKLPPLQAAAARAHATGHPVIVSSMTTSTSVTKANPDGSFTVDETLLPARVRQHGGWRPLDATLRRQPGGRVAPVATASGLTLSGGGQGPLAVLNNVGRTLTLSWPASLPAPSLSGASATYANVLPGVDLVVTATDQGGFSDALVIQNAAAAANPALASLKVTVVTPGMTVSADAAGDLAAKTGPNATPAFTAQAPQMWDSAPLPAGTQTMADPITGKTLALPSGLPASSSAAAPGAGSHVSQVPVAVNGGTITLSPPSSALNGPGVVYPVYIDPNWTPSTKASAWAEVLSGHGGNSYWKPDGDLQSGLCYDSPKGACNGIGVARSFIQMPIPSQLHTNTTVLGASLYMTEQVAPSCTKTSVRLYGTGPISPSTTWNEQPGWSSDFLWQDAAYGYPGCAGFKDDITWNVQSYIQNAAAQGWANQTWGIRAADETQNLQWKQFLSGASNLHMSVRYDDPPNTPSGRTTRPGGGCSYSASGGPTIGNDDVTFSANVGDPDGDTNMTTKFYIVNSDGTVAYYSSNNGTNWTGGTPAQLSLTRQTIQGFHSDGATKAYTYHWYALTTDNAGLVSPKPSGDCYFTYNPTRPGAPTVAAPASATLGQQFTATIKPPANCQKNGSCPVSYAYQIGVSTPTTVNVGQGSCTASSCPVNVTMNQLGPADLTVSGYAAGGNPGEAGGTSVQGNPPSAPYSDGYFTGGKYPDVLTLGTGKQPGLWVNQGTGNGTLGTATNIGSLGTGLNAPGSAADWAGAQALHGDFTGNHVQDLMAYYPATGTGFVTGGTGASATALPATSSPYGCQVPSVALQDGNFPVATDVPTKLLAAGNASQITGEGGVADLIGVLGDATNGYELNMYTVGSTTNGGGGSGTTCGYGLANVLSAGNANVAPDGTADWQNYQLATVQLPDAAFPAGDPANTVLFALDTINGKLWESVNPGCPTAAHPTTTCSTTTLVGMPGTFTLLNVPWSSAPTVVSADVNNGGQPGSGGVELWTRSGTSATAYTVSGSTVTKEGSGTTVSQPSHDWPLTDGNAAAQGPAATSAADTITGTTDAAALASGANWGEDNYFITDIKLDGATGYLDPPSGTLPDSEQAPSVSVWFKTTTADGVLASLQGHALSTGNTISGGYNPVMYIGTDGKVYAEWWNGTLAPIASSTIVTDGLWHHAVLTATTASGGSQTLYIDGHAQGKPLGGTVSLTQTNPTNLTFGAGYTGGSWPAEPHYKQNGNTGFRDYFHGEMAALTVS